MSLIMYNRSLIPNWSNLMDTFFDDSLLLQEQSFNIPAVNETEEDSFYTIKMAVSGLEKGDFNIEIENNVLTISSKKEKSAETQEDNFTRKEYSYSSFKRSFSIPENTKKESIEANYKNRELILTIPEREVTISKAKLIEVA